MGLAAILVMWQSHGLFEKTFVPHPREDQHELWLISPVVSEDMLKNVNDDEIWVTLDQGQRNDLDLRHMLIFMYTFSLQYLYIIYCNRFWEIHYLGVFPYKA